MLLFSYGVLCAGVLSAVRYLVQFSYARLFEAEIQNKDDKFWRYIGYGFHGFCVFLGLLSLILFSFGSWQAYKAVLL